MQLLTAGRPRTAWAQARPPGLKDPPVTDLSGAIALGLKRWPSINLQDTKQGDTYPVK